MRPIAKAFPVLACLLVLSFAGCGKQNRAQTYLQRGMAL